MEKCNKEEVMKIVGQIMDEEIRETENGVYFNAHKYESYLEAVEAKTALIKAYLLMM